MSIQIGKYKRPGIFLEEYDDSVITSPTLDGITNLVIGVSKKGPVNTPILLRNVNDLEKIFGPVDRQLERKGSFFHRTISKMLEASPVYAINLLLSDDNLDTIEYQSLSAASSYQNDTERTAPYRRFFNNTGFWKRDTDSFINITKNNLGYYQRAFNLTNLSDKYISVFCFKTKKTGFDRPMLEWYGSIEKMPPYVYPNDLASDYMVDIIVIGGDWSNYNELSVDNRWSRYFSQTGLRKEMVREFANNRNINLLAYYEGVSLIPYFRDSDQKNIFIETVINRDTDKTGLFCSFNSDLVETDYPTGLIDLIGNNIVGDTLLNNPPTSGLTNYTELDTNDGVSDGQISIDFLSYKETITEIVPFTNVVLDRPGNVFSIVDYSLTNIHSYDGGTASYGGLLTGDVLNSNRTAWFAEGYVNGNRGTGDGLYCSTYSITSLTASVTYNVGDNAYAIIGGQYIPISTTSSFSIKNTDYASSSTTQSFYTVFSLNNQGTISKVSSNQGGVKPSVSSTDIVLGYLKADLYQGLIKNTSTFTHVTTDLNGYNPLSFGTSSNDDYTVSTASLSTGSYKIEFLNTNNIADVRNYEQYRRFKVFNNFINILNGSNKAKVSMITDVSTMEKKSFETMNISNILLSTTSNKSFVLNTGMTYSLSDITSGSLMFYTKDDEFILGNNGVETVDTVASLSTTGVVGKYSQFYIKYDQGVINNGDLIYQNVIHNPIDITFVPGSGSFSGSDYIVFYTDDADDQNYLRQLSSFNEFLIPNSILNPGSIKIISDENTAGTSGANIIFSTPELRAAAIGYGPSPSTAFAFQVSKDVVFEELTSITRLHDYTVNGQVYLKMNIDSSNKLTVEFTDVDLTSPVTFGTDGLDPSGDSLLSNQIIYVNSLDSNFKQSIEIEYPTGYTSVPNKILVNAARYSEIKVGDYLEAYYDVNTLQDNQMPKKLTRILSKRIWTGDSSLIEISCDATIKTYDYSGSIQTYRYTKIEDYVTSYKAISLKGFRIRQESLPDGTEDKQNQILNIVAKGTPIFKSLKNKETFDFRYLIDSFGLGLVERSKQQLLDIVGDRLDSFAFLNMPSIKSFKNSTSPSFTDVEGTLSVEFITQGGDPESNPAFVYSFGDGPGTTCAGYFTPYVTVNDNGRPAEVPPAAWVALAYMRKHTSNATSITPWTIAAGVTNGKISNVAGLEIDFSTEDIEFLNQAQMNPIVYKRNRGYIIDTENTAQTLYKSSLSYIHCREVLIELERELSRMLLDFQWKYNTPEIRAEIKLRADVICEKYVARNGLYNYFNKCDAENNTNDIIDNQIGVLDTYVEVIKGMGIIVNNVTVLRTGAIQSGGFIIP